MQTHAPWSPEWLHEKNTAWADYRTREQAIIDDIVALGSRIAAAQYMHLVRIRDLERMIQLRDCTFAEFIAWRCHLDVKTAYELIRVAEALESLPEIARLFAEGRITYSKVRVVTRVATKETDEVYALHAFHCTVRQLEMLVRHHRTVLPDEVVIQRLSRYLRFTENEDGSFILRARLTAEQGIVLKKAIEAALSFDAADTKEQANVDALERMATAALTQLATGEAPVLKVRCDESLHAENITRFHERDASSRHAENAASHDAHSPANLHAENTASRDTHSPSRLHAEKSHAICCSLDGHAIAPTVAERLLCDGTIGRSASKTQRAKLRVIHHGNCAHPRCTHRSFLEGHHIKLWSHGGKTELSNLTLLCSKHHRQLHEGDFSVHRDEATNALVFTTPQGRLIEASPPASPVAAADRSLSTTVATTIANLGLCLDKPNYDASIEMLQHAQAGDCGPSALEDIRSRIQ